MIKPKNSTLQNKYSIPNGNTNLTQPTNYSILPESAAPNPTTGGNPLDDSLKTEPPQLAPKPAGEGSQVSPTPTDEGKKPEPPQNGSPTPTEEKVQTTNKEEKKPESSTEPTKGQQDLDAPSLLSGNLIRLLNASKKIAFSEACLDTCSLENFNQEIYKLVFEVSDAKIRIDTISYDYQEVINTDDIIDVLDKEGREIGSHEVKVDEKGLYEIDIRFDKSLASSLTGRLLSGFQIKPQIEPYAKFNGLKDLPKKLVIKYGTVNETHIKTPVFSANPIQMDNATITLPKTSRVDKIFECADFDQAAFVCPSSWKQTDIPFEDNGDTITFTVKHFSGYGGGTIDILNLQSYPTVGGNWTVRFNTTGTENLTITAINGTTWSNQTENFNLKFLELKCGNTVLKPTWVSNSADGSNNSVFYQNYTCNQTSYEISKVLKAGVHILEFDFGNDTKYARNDAITPTFNDTGQYIGTICNRNEEIGFCDLNHYNFSLRVITNKYANASNITSNSSNVENSDRVLGATHNKTSEVYVGDAIDYNTKNSNNAFVDILFLNRNMFIYNKTGTVKNITSANANTGSCQMLTNSSTQTSMSCSISNDDISLTSTFINNVNNTHPIIFFNAENIAGVPITLIEYYNYADFDATTKPGYETRDDIIALIKHPVASDQTEQIVKEAYVVCDTKGLLPENDIGKCSTAGNDTFFVMQQLGGGTPNPAYDIFAGFSTKYTPVTRTNIIAAFVNPSTDTDNQREVPPSKVVVSSNSPANKADIALIGNLEGLILQPGEKFIKYFGLVGTSTIDKFKAAVDETVISSPIDIVDDRINVTDIRTNKSVTQIGAYQPINITIELANTAGENQTNIIFNCTVKGPSGDAASVNTTLNISAQEVSKKLSCSQGGLNADNTLLPGVYNITAKAKSTLNEEIATGNFTILTDYSGTNNIAVNRPVYRCGDNINVTSNITNIGNTNFTSNLTFDLFQASSFVKNLNTYNGTFLLKNSQNITSFNYTITECSSSANYTIKVNRTIKDENDGLVNLTNQTYWYDDNVFPNFTYAPGYENGSAVFKRFKMDINAVDDYAVDTCIITLEKGTETNYTMVKSGNSCSLDINLTSNGKTSYRIILNDSVDNVNASDWKNIDKFDPPSMTKFSSGKTTKLETAITNGYNQTNFTVETSFGKISWLNGLYLVGQDLESNIDLVSNQISVDSGNLHNSFNNSAEITIYNLTGFVDPIVLVNSSGTFRKCSYCTRLSFNRTSTELVFNTTSFSAYAGAEGTNLTIFDDSDAEGGSITRYAAQLIRFTANYSNSTSQPVISSGSACNVAFNNTGAWGTALTMPYNSTRQFYEYNRSFNQRGTYFYNITCTSGTNANLTLIDNVTLPNWIPTIPVLLSPANGTSIYNRTPPVIWNNTVENDALDNITYDVLVDDNIAFSLPTVNATVNQSANITNTTHAIQPILEVDRPYFWKVRAYDGTNYSDYSNVSNFTVLSLLSILFVRNSTNFGSIGISQTNDTSDSIPLPLLIENDGNILANATIYATRFFPTVVPPTINYQFKFRANESGSFNTTQSTTTYKNMNITNIVKELVSLNWSDISDTANIDINITIPPDDPGTNTGSLRNSTITIELV